MTGVPFHLARLISEAPGVPAAVLLVHAIRASNRALIKRFQ